MEPKVSTGNNVTIASTTSLATVHSAQGRDWSSFQHPITSIDLQGLSFGYTRFSNWTSFPSMGIDVNAAHNWAEMKQFGKHRGAYWYFFPNVSAVAQADFFFNAVHAQGLEDGDMLVCDSEEAAGNVDSATHAFMSRLDERCAADGIHAINIVYTNNNIGQHLNSCTKWPLWFAHPSSTAPSAALISPWKHWDFWQWGIVAGVDADAFNGTPTDLQNWINSKMPTTTSFKEWLTQGGSSLQGISNAVGQPVGTILRQTATHFGTFDTPLFDYLNGLANGSVKHTDHIKAGARLWVKG